MDSWCVACCTGVFDRSKPLPGGGSLEQVSGILVIVKISVITLVVLSFYVCTCLSVRDVVWLLFYYCPCAIDFYTFHRRL